MWKKLLLVIIIIAAVIFSVSKITAKKTVLKTEAATRRDIEVTTDVSGKVKADRSASLSFPVTGQIEKVASAGARFKTGDSLASLKADDLLAAVLQAYANLNKANSTFYYYLEVKGETEKTYLGDDDTSRAKRNEARVNAEAAAAGVDGNRFALQQSQALLGKTVLRAPYDGIVGRVYSKVGENASAASPVLDIFDQASFYFEVEADEIDIYSLKPGQPVRIKLDAFGEKEFNGRILSLDPGSHTTSSGGTAYYVRIGFTDDFDSKGVVLRSGLNGEAKIIKEIKKDVLTIPSSAVETTNGKSYAEVLINGQERQKHEVVLGELVENAYEVLSGIQEGDLVILHL